MVWHGMAPRYLRNLGFCPSCLTCIQKPEAFLQACSVVVPSGPASGDSSHDAHVHLRLPQGCAGAAASSADDVVTVTLAVAAQLLQPVFEAVPTFKVRCMRLHSSEASPVRTYGDIC